MYRIVDSLTVQRVEDGSCIPTDPLNLDYKAYLGWVAEGNSPQPAPEIPGPTPQDQIDAIERQTMVPRVVRESLLAFAQLLAQQQAAVSGKSVAEILAANVAYQKVKAVDDQINQLRSLIP